MAIFKIHGEKLKTLKSGIPLEIKLQKLIENNLKEIFGLEFIKSEFGGEGLSIDTIAYDPQIKSPVIIEYKRDMHSSIVDQGLAYLNWLLTHKGDFLVELNERLNTNLRKKDLNWSQTRVIFIAKNFSTHSVRASSFQGIPFELWQYEWCEDVFEIHQIETPKSGISLASATRNVPPPKVTQEIKTYTVEDHLEKTTEQIKRLFEKIKNSILSLDERIQEKPVTGYIGYRVRYHNFVMVSISKEKIRIYVRIDKIDDPQKLFQMAVWDKGKLWYVDILSDKDIEYLLFIIKQAYISAPDR